MKGKTYSIKKKLILFMIMATLIPNMLITFFLLRRMTETVRRELCVSQQSNISHILKRFDLMLKDMDMIAANIVSDKDLYGQIEGISGDGSAFNNYKLSNSIKQHICRLRDTKAEIDSIYIIDLKNNRGFSTKQYGYASGEWMDFFGWNVLQEQASMEDSWGTFCENANLSLAGAESFETRKMFYRKRTYYQEGHPAFSLYVNIKVSTIENILEAMATVPNSKLYMVGENMDVIASDKLDEGLLEEALKHVNDTELYHTFEYKNIEYLCTYAHSDMINGGIIAVIPTSKIDDSLRNTKIISDFITVASVVIILIFGYYVYFLFYRPIERLIAVMQKNESGKIMLCDLASRKDEFGRLGKQFNDMILKVSTLNERLYKQELSTRNAEIKLLQSQINPHFLYNVLENIHWMAKMGQTEKVSQMAVSLSHYYRRSLSGGRSFVSLRDAVDLMCSYWDVVKIRFQDKVELSVEIEDTVENCIVPKQMLQPILENTINHGIENVDRKVLIIVTALDCGETMKVVIEDSGCGIAPNQLETLQRDLQSTDPVQGNNFALRNLNSQIRLTYGEQYGLTIKSELGEGTTITIRVPKKFEFLDGEVKYV